MKDFIVLLGYHADKVVGSLRLDVDAKSMVIAPATSDGEVVNFGIFPISQLDHRFGSLVAAIEAHQKESDRIGRLNLAGEITDAEIVAATSEADDTLYKAMDQLWIGQQTELNSKVETLEGALGEDGDYLVGVKDGEFVEIKALPGMHVVELRGEDGFSFEHPAECRRKGSLHDCELWKAFQNYARENPESSFREQEGRFYISREGDLFRLEEIDA